MITSLLCLLFIFLGILNATKLYRSLSWLKNKSADGAISPTQIETNFLLIIPLLREQAGVQALIERLHKLKYSDSQFKILLVTTQKEERVGDKPTTAEVIAKYMPETSNLYHLHYSHTKGYKADQLNWAIKKLETDGVIDDTWAIGVYDADSDIKPDTLKKVSRIFQTTNTNVVQQPSLYFKNWRSLPTLARSFAVYQTVYGCFFELTSWRTWKRSFPAMRYCTGHGLYVKLKYLRKIGYFPSPLEDTRFGHICALLNEPIVVVPQFDDCETAPGTFARIQQGSVWFSGDVQYMSALPVARNVQNVPLHFAAWLFLNKTYRTLVWLLQGLVVIACLGAAFLTKNVPLIGAILLYCWLPAITLFANQHRFSGVMGSSVKQGAPIFPILLLPLAGFLKSLSPWYAIYRFVRAKLSGNDLLFPKTERS